MDERRGFDMIPNDITPELKDKLQNCKTPEEILTLAKEEGYELSDEELEKIAGGDGWTGYETVCNNCQKRVVWYDSDPIPAFCPHCGCKFNFTN